MLVNTYISASDYESLSKYKPLAMESVPSFMADILRKHAAELRKIHESATVQMPQYARD